LPTRQLIRQYFIVSIGCLLMGFAVNAFFVPTHLLSMGVSAIAMISYFIFETPIGIGILVLNIPLFILAYRLLNRAYIWHALCGMFLSSLAIDMLYFFRDWKIVEDPMLSAIYGGVFFGLASGMIFRVNGSTGGADILAAIFRKYYGINMGLFSFLFNIGIMVIAAFLFKVETAMYTLLGIFVASQVTDKVVAGFNSKKAIWIITDRPDEIAQGIFARMNRGVTYVDAVGAYTGRKRKMLYIVVTLTQTPKIREIVQQTDPQAFMTIQDASEVLGQGKGFSSLTD
jgi:Uncharacterized conserved protein